MREVDGSEQKGCGSHLEDPCSRRWVGERPPDGSDLQEEGRFRRSNIGNLLCTGNCSMDERIDAADSKTDASTEASEASAAATAAAAGCAAATAAATAPKGEPCGKRERWKKR